MLTYLLALLAACANATSSVLQRTANRRVPRTQNLSPRLIGSLLHQPVWFGGVLAVTVGFLLQAVAPGTGQLAAVEPVLVLELPVTLLLASQVLGTGLHRREWGATAAMTAALAGLLYCLAPSSGRAQGVPWYAWVTGIGVNVAVVVTLTVWGRTGPAGKSGGDGRSGAHQAAVLGVAAGSGFGLTAALMKGMTTAYVHGIGGVFTSWELYAMVVSGVLSMFLLQSAVNAGRLAHPAGGGLWPGPGRGRDRAGPLPAAGARHRRAAVTPPRGPCATVIAVCAHRPRGAPGATLRRGCRSSPAVRCSLFHASLPGGIFR